VIVTRELTLWDLLATLITAPMVVPFVGYSVYVAREHAAGHG
jgi:hypothetical protein